MQKANRIIVMLYGWKIFYDIFSTNDPDVKGQLNY